jgi:hypothetical protein
VASYIGRQVEADVGYISEKYNFMKSVSQLIDQRVVQGGLKDRTLEEAILSINVMEQYWMDAFAKLDYDPVLATFMFNTLVRGPEQRMSEGLIRSGTEAMLFSDGHGHLPLEFCVMAHAGDKFGRYTN